MTFYKNDILVLINEMINLLDPIVDISIAIYMKYMNIDDRINQEKLKIIN